MILPPYNSLPSTAINPPHTSFYRLIPQATLPQRADRSAAGTLPTRAARYCDAVTQASGFGWWVFPPISFSLVWDDHDILWTWDSQPGDTEQEENGWYQLTDAAQFPGFSVVFDASAPAAAVGYAPPFLTRLLEPGHVQIWTGLIARTTKDWSLLVRSPANLPIPGGFALYEGIIETDHWFGPLFTNVRLTRTGTPVRFDANFPLAQIQPLHRSMYADATLNAVATVDQASDMTDDDWQCFIETVVLPNQDPDRSLGTYAVAARKRRRHGMCPIAHHQDANSDE